MTYKGTGWTRGDLGNVPDRNPFIECNRCEDSYKWKQWQQWYDEITPETEFLCPDCREEKQRLERRKENNQKLQEFTQ